MCVRLKRDRGHLNLLHRKREIVHCIVDRERDRGGGGGWKGRKKWVRRV